MDVIHHRKSCKYFLPVLICLGLITLAYGASSEKIKLELDQARENLRISEVTAARIITALEELKASGTASPEIIHDYEVYLARVQALVRENRNIVRGMETAYARLSPRKEAAARHTSKDLKGVPDSKIPEEQTTDEVAALDREFNDSLAEFDEMLLKEFETIRSRAEEKMRDLTAEAAEAAERLRKKGVELDEDESLPSSPAEGGEQEADRERDAADSEKTPGIEENPEDRGITSHGKAGESDRDQSAESKRRYNKEDDDIVARQLREAAENETDPELKEKLWKEYEEYKENTRQ